MVNLNDDQKVELEVELLRLQGRGVITDDQRTEIMRAVLGIELTAEEAEYERRAVTPTENDKKVRRASA
jgi:hypothetical protein